MDTASATNSKLLYIIWGPVLKHT